MDAKLQTYIGQETNQIISFDGIAEDAGQCVQNVAKWGQFLGLPVLYQNAANWWTNTTPAFLEKWDKIANNPKDPNQLPLPGSVVIFSSAMPGSQGYGHCDIFIRNLGVNSWEGFDSNWNGKNAKIVDHNWSYVLGWYTPKEYEAPARTPVAPVSNPVIASAPTAQAVAEATYNVLVNLNGYSDANEAVNHTGSAVAVEPGTYHIFNEAHGMKNVTKNVGVPGAWINPNDNVAPVVAPSKPQNVVYTLWTGPADMVANKQPTNWWELDFVNDTKAKAAAQLAQGTPFTAYGKAQRTDGDKPVYLMTKEDFGNADTTGVPVNNNGINIVDLSPAPVVASPAPADPAPAVAPAVEATPAVTASPTSDSGEKVAVTVNPDGWKASFQAFLSPQTFTANTSVEVYDLDTSLPVSELHPASQQLVKGQKVVIAGKFTKGIDSKGNPLVYYRTLKSLQGGYWYGIPEKALDSEADTANDNLLEEIWNNAPKIKKDLNLQNNKEKILEAAGTIDGVITRVFKRKKN